MLNQTTRQASLRNKLGRSIASPTFRRHANTETLVIHTKRVFLKSLYHNHRISGYSIERYGVNTISHLASLPTRWRGRLRIAGQSLENGELA